MIKILELKKLGEDVPENDSVYSWMKFFGGKTKKEFENMAQTDEYIDEAYETLKQLNADERKRLEYEAREKALRDYNQQEKSYYDRGHAEGLEEGRNEERTLAIRNLVTSCKKFGGSREAIRNETAEKYQLSANEAERYMNKYW